MLSQDLDCSHPRPQNHSGYNSHDDHQMRDRESIFFNDKLHLSGISTHFSADSTTSSRHSSRSSSPPSAGARKPGKRGRNQFGGSEGSGPSSDDESGSSGSSSESRASVLQDGIAGWR